MMAISNQCNHCHTQRGATLLILMLILLISGSSVLFSLISGNNARFDREKKTLVVLEEAKVALLSYAASVNLSHAGCDASCRRPGDLPCPDTNNDGTAETSCGNATGSTGQSARLGRLPWKTLGLDDLRDGDGNRLWYAVSNRFKQDARAFPLNSDTLGSLSIRDGSGNLLHDSTASSGAVAVVISVGTAITRQDAVVQSRISANENNSIHFLDNALGEDNADFVDGGINGFIKGEIHDAVGTMIFNDQLIVVSHSEIMNAIEPIVSAEVKNAVSSYKLAHAVYPSPASFSDVGCLGLAAIGTGLCLPNTAINGGRVPVNPVPDWNPTSILIGTSNNNWFQQNGWREHVYYANGTLTLNGAVTAGTKELIIIASSSAIGPQVRALNADKVLESNYLELENISPLDTTYLRLPMIQHSTSFNDFPVSVP